MEKSWMSIVSRPFIDLSTFSFHAFRAASSLALGDCGTAFLRERNMTHLKIGWCAARRECDNRSAKTANYTDEMQCRRNTLAAGFPAEEQNFKSSGEVSHAIAGIPAKVFVGNLPHRARTN